MISGCALASGEIRDDASAALDVDGTNGADPGYVPPPDRLLCPDETSKIESDTDINAGSSDLSTFAKSGTWIAWKYAPALDHVMGKVCLASKPLVVPTKIYLLADNGGAPGPALKSGDLYNTMSGYACTLDVPFDFTASVEAGHVYWFATDMATPIVANDGARIPFWKGSSDPGIADPSWSAGCSAGFVAEISMNR